MEPRCGDQTMRWINNEKPSLGTVQGRSDSYKVVREIGYVYERGETGAPRKGVRERNNNVD